MPSRFSSSCERRICCASSVWLVHEVPQKTRVALVEAPIGATSFSYLRLNTSCASSTSSSAEAVAPTMLLSGAAERKVMRPLPHGRSNRIP